MAKRIDLGTSPEQRLTEQRIQETMQSRHRAIERMALEQGYRQARNEFSSFKKPLECIRIITAKSKTPLNLTDRRVMNLLQANAAQNLKGDGSNIADMLEMSIKDMSDFLNIPARDVKTSLQRLMSCEVEYDYLNDVREKWTGNARLFASETMEFMDEGNKARFAYVFPPRIMQLFQAPKTFAYVNLSAVFSFSSKYSLALYENLAPCVNLDYPEWTVDVDSLAALLGWNPGKRKGKDGQSEAKPFNFSIFRRDCLDVAIEDINRLLKDEEFSVSFKKENDSERRVRKVTFIVTPAPGKGANSDQFKSRYKSMVPAKMPDGFLEGLSISLKRAWELWDLFRRQHRDARPANMREAWVQHVISSEQKKQSNKNVSDAAIWRVYNEYKNVLANYGQADRKACETVLREIWNLRVDEARGLLTNGGVDGLEAEIVDSAMQDQNFRDKVFHKVIDNEAASGWPSIPVADDKAAQRIHDMRDDIRDGIVKLTALPRGLRRGMGKSAPRKAVAVPSVTKSLEAESGWPDEVPEKVQKDFFDFQRFVDDDEDRPVNTFELLEKARKEIGWTPDWRPAPAQSRQPLVTADEDDDVPF